MIDWKNLIARRKQKLAEWNARLTALIGEMRVQLTTPEIMQILLYHAMEFTIDWMNDVYNGQFDELLTELRKRNERHKP